MATYKRLFMLLIALLVPAFLANAQGQILNAAKAIKDGIDDPGVTAQITKDFDEREQHLETKKELLHRHKRADRERDFEGLMDVREDINDYNAFEQKADDLYQKHERFVHPEPHTAGHKIIWKIDMPPLPKWAETELSHYKLPPLETEEAYFQDLPPEDDQ